MDCDHDDDRKYKIMRLCTDRVCELNKVTLEDKIIIDTGFNLFIVLHYLRDLFGNDQEYANKLTLVKNENEDDNLVN